MLIYCNKLRIASCTTQDNNSQKQKIWSPIDKLSMDSRNEFSEYYFETINTDALVSKMKVKELNKKEEVECFGSQLQDELQAKCNSILEAKSKVSSDETKNTLKM